MSLIYLDFNRTTPVAPSVVQAMEPYWQTHFMLPGQEHVQAQAVCEALEHAREGLAKLAGCEPFEIVFTAGGTEANNLAIAGQCGPATDLAAAGAGAVKRESMKQREEDPRHILVSSLEHDSVLGPVRRLVDQGWQCDQVPCDEQGLVDVETVQAMLRDDTRLVCMQLANPVLGTLQPIRQIADLCHSRGVLVHCDATQAFGKLPVDVTSLRADTVAISGHKFYGPKGSGALFVRRGLHLAPIQMGEPREMGLRPGPENIPACIGAGAAASLAARCAADVAEQLGDLRDHFCNGLVSAFGEQAILLATDVPRLPNTVAVELPAEARKVQRFARQMVMATAQSDSPPDEMTRALRAIGRTDCQIGRTLRFSLGWTSSHEQVDRAVELLAEATDANPIG